MNIEIWKVIPGSDGMYEASSEGRIRSWYKAGNLADGVRVAERPKIMRSTVSQYGYLLIGLILNNHRKTMSVHRIIAKTHIPNPKNKREVNHINGNKLDNKVANLEWSTSSENQKHAYLNGLQQVKKGNDCTWSKLTETDILDIRAAYPTGWFTQKEIADAYSVKRQAIGDIINYRNWRHI